MILGPVQRILTNGSLVASGHIIGATDDAGSLVTGVQGAVGVLYKIWTTTAAQTGTIVPAIGVYPSWTGIAVATAALPPAVPSTNPYALHATALAASNFPSEAQAYFSAIWFGTTGGLQYVFPAPGMYQVFTVGSATITALYIEARVVMQNSFASNGTQILGQPIGSAISPSW